MAYAKGGIGMAKKSEEVWRNGERIKGKSWYDNCQLEQEETLSDAGLLQSGIYFDSSGRKLSEVVGGNGIATEEVIVGITGEIKETCLTLYGVTDYCNVEPVGCPRLIESEDLN